jgi:hypothetical protein
MSFEESIDKLKERHEALTQTVEIIASMQKETERRLQEFVTRTGEALAALLQVVQDHERRLDNLDNPGNLPPSQN